MAFDGDALHVGVEQDVEGLAGFAVDCVFASDDELVEEGLVGEASQRVVNAHVDRVAVAGQGEAVIQVGLRLLVLDVAGVDLGV
ncbi:hypothetical protein [Amycolatopsis sacchari]|uniref:hypothetical protein n=1 Tax=Amycolatopsis TaxID=1813 RepID=UPI003D7368AD